MAEPGKEGRITATLPVTKEVQDKILARLEKALPADMAAMLIGGTLLLQRGIHPTGRTKDTDVVLLVHRQQEFEIPSVETVVGVLKSLATDIRVRKDETSVGAIVELEEGPFLVELVRGRGAHGGYFVRRTLLKRIAPMSRKRGKLLEPPLEALAVLKAWAATDQDKLVDTDRDQRGYHEARAADFRRDVRLCLDALLENGQEPNLSLMQGLLEGCSKDRRERMRAVLLEQGWALPR